MIKKALISTAALVTLTGCSLLLPKFDAESDQVVCASYLIYDMCAFDMELDGIVDYFYFADDDQVFLTRDGFDPSVLGKPLHPCRQVMNPELQQTANDILNPEVRANPARRDAAKRSLFARYTSELPNIARCQAEKMDRAPEDADDFLDG